MVKPLSGLLGDVLHFEREGLDESIGRPCSHMPPEPLLCGAVLGVALSFYLGLFMSQKAQRAAVAPLDISVQPASKYCWVNLPAVGSLDYVSEPT